jgi:hypothetical protein
MGIFFLKCFDKASVPDISDKDILKNKKFALNKLKELG